MKKILVSLSVIVAVGAIVAGATGAFFSDEEVSRGNTFTAGEIDLQIDNTCYYNGNACVLDTASGISYWGGNREPGNECGCNWELKDLENELFFDFNDLKPGDWEEDTISFHVGSNDAWVCADVTLASNADNTCTEPEDPDDLAADGIACGVGDPNLNGDLAQELNFIWWVDDGDNVLENDEKLLAPAGILGDLGVGNTATVAIADTSGNAALGDIPVPGGDRFFIGKGFCYGEITPRPVPAGEGQDPTVDGGFDCDGTLVNNASQTDSSTMDIAFRAIQSRNNDSFQCVAPI
ncbi:MAG TPA: TasA family protein [Candidatus Paceibacterota bacterium]